MVNYRRNRLPGGCYFFTVTLSNRSSALLTERIDALRTAFRSVRRERPFAVHAMVVLPDHLHCIWQLPPGDADYSLRWREINARFSRLVPTGEERSSGRIKQNERGLWQRRFWEHTLRDDRDVKQHVQYIHYNPVKHGYVAHVADWPYSSFHRYVRQGLYPLDWAGGGVEGGTGFGE